MNGFELNFCIEKVQSPGLGPASKQFEGDNNRPVARMVHLPFCLTPSIFGFGQCTLTLFYVTFSFLTFSRAVEPSRNYHIYAGVAFLRALPSSPLSQSNCKSLNERMPAQTFVTV